MVRLHVFAKPDAVARFGKAFRSTIRLDEGYFKRCVAAGEIRHDWMSMVINMENKPRWRAAAIGRVAEGILDFAWSRGFDAPLWLKMGLSHHAEYGILGGKSSYFFVVPDTPPSTLAEERAQLTNLFESGENPSLAQLMKTNDARKMSPEDETMATVFLDFLLKKKFHAFHRFMFDTKVNGNLEKVHAATFQQTPAELEREFATWLGVKLDD